MGTVVNRELSSLQRGSIEITITVSKSQHFGYLKWKLIYASGLIEGLLWGNLI